MIGQRFESEVMGLSMVIVVLDFLLAIEGGVVTLNEQPDCRCTPPEEFQGR